MKTNMIVLLVLSGICLCGCQGSRQRGPAPSATSQTTVGAQTRPAPMMVDGKLGASLIRIAVPARWNRDVLIFAHGLRSADAPLTAEFSTGDAMFRALIGEGWMIACTSYRRNGYIIDEAIDDIDQLREHIIATYGTPRRVFLDGASMGGAIVTRMAETHEGKYSGALVVGAALVIRRNPYDFHPKMPLLMMSNQNEMGDLNAYAAKAAQAKTRPARWIIKRDGHCNVTHEEELAGVRAVVQWSETGAIELQRDATIVPPVPPSVATFTESGASAKVMHVASSTGNCDTEFTASDLARLGIALRSRFQVTCKSKTITVLYGTKYGDVPKGEWVAFILAEGSRLRIARNSADAAAVLNCATGDTMSIAPLKEDAE